MTTTRLKWTAVIVTTSLVSGFAALAVWVPQPTADLISQVIGVSVMAAFAIGVIFAFIADLFKQPDHTEIYHAPITGTSYTICTKDSDFLDSETTRLKAKGWEIDGPLVMGGQRNHFFIQRMKREPPASTPS